MSGRCVVEAISGGKISPVSRSKRKTQSFPHLRRSLDTRGLRVWREEGRLIAFVPSGTSLMKGAVAAQFSFLTLDQKSSKYFCKHPKIKLCRQRYLPCKSETLQAFNTCRRVQVCPQREHALSISEFPHRRKLSGVGVVLVIAWREKRSSPSLIPNISRRQVRSECITSVHSKNFPWISSFLSLDNCSSVSTSETRFSILFREDAWLLLQTDLDCNWLEADGFASTTVAAQACSTAGGNFFVQVLCRWTCASYSFLHRGSAEFLRRSMRTICICFQKVTKFVICRLACPDLPKNRIEVFAGRGRPDQFFRNFVETDCNVFTKVAVRSSAVKYQLILATKRKTQTQMKYPYPNLNHNPTDISPTLTQLKFQKLYWWAEKRRIIGVNEDRQLADRWLF